MRLVTILLIVVGVAFIAVGVIYFTVDADSLPGFLGQLHGIHQHRTRRGDAAVALGIICLVLGVLGNYALRKRPVDV
jgi:amino acid permease